MQAWRAGAVRQGKAGEAIIWAILALGRCCDAAAGRCCPALSPPPPPCANPLAARPLSIALNARRRHHGEEKKQHNDGNNTAGEEVEESEKRRSSALKFAFRRAKWAPLCWERKLSNPLRTFPCCALSAKYDPSRSYTCCSTARSSPSSLSCCCLSSVTTLLLVDAPKACACSRVSSP